MLRTALELERRLGFRVGMMGTLASLARIAGELGDMQRAGLLWGPVEAEEARRPAPWAMDPGRWTAAVVARDEPE